MRTFRDIPIRQKLGIIVMVTTATGMLIASLGVVAFDSYFFRRSLERDLLSLAQMIADNTTAALSFNDPRAATETLAALRARPHMVAACIYRPDATMFAAYSRLGGRGGCPAADRKDGIQVSSSGLIVSRAIMLTGERIGTLVLLYDLGEIPERIKIYGGTVLGVLLVSSLLTFLLSANLRAVIATPIAQLVRATTSVSETGDYSTRAEKLSGDELGVLVDRFNEMLAGIEWREANLRTALREQKEKEEELRRANDDLQQFAYSASHDLQEPIRNVAIYSEIVAKRYRDQLDADGQQFLGFLTEGGRRLSTLINDLLAYTRAGVASDTAPARADSSVVLQHTLSSLAEAIRESGATVTHDGLPEVPMSEAHLQQMFQNLIGNALKYRKDEPLQIHISAVKAEGAWRFSVRDNGIGIDPQYNEKIFGVFKRLHRDQKYSGTGIGLAICQRVVRRYGGRIWVESVPGEGSTFCFTIPEQDQRGRSPTAESFAG
jgi:signal transduction histidine kinase